MTIARPVSAFISAAVAGLSENFFSFSSPQQEKQADAQQGCGCGKDQTAEQTSKVPVSWQSFLRNFPAKLKAGIQYAIFDIWEELAGWFRQFEMPRGMEKWTDAFMTPAGMAELHNTKQFLRALADQLDGAEVDASVIEALDGLVSVFTELI